MLVFAAYPLVYTETNVLAEAGMANKEQLAILKQTLAEWNRWRQKYPDIRPDLSGADLSGADLSGADLTRAFLIEADLTGAVLTGAVLTGAVLTGAVLTGAVLTGAVLTGAVLTGANLSRARLSRARLSRANLTGANLTGANLEGTDLTEATVNSTIFANVDLSRVQGLKTVEHRAPSTIGIDTLQQSNGKIPADFLRGCGVPDSWIEYLPTLIGALQPIQFYSCFISYSTKDEEFAKRLYGRMQQEHLRVWFAPEHMKGGEKLNEQIERAIQVHDRLLVVLSEQTIQSEWVTTELYTARQAELQQQRRKLFPIRLCGYETLKAWKCFDAETGKDLAREVREYYIPNFSDWKNHDTFEVAFARLLRDLKATEALPIPSPVAVQPTLSVPPASTRTHIQGLMTTKTRRLQHLEQQQARTGDSTLPEVLMELEDLRRELADLGQRLAEMKGEDTKPTK